MGEVDACSCIHNHHHIIIIIISSSLHVTIGSISDHNTEAAVSNFCGG